MPEVLSDETLRQRAALLAEQEPVFAAILALASAARQVFALADPPGYPALAVMAEAWRPTALWLPAYCGIYT